jgi:hypothetical protein
MKGFSPNLLQLTALPYVCIKVESFFSIALGAWTVSSNGLPGRY